MMLYIRKRGIMTEFRAQERAFDATLIFQVVLTIPTKTLASQLPRRERWILLLLDGKRCIADLADLTQRSELDVAYKLARFLQSGSIEPLDENLSQ
jgi:hypothetical protein